MLRSGGQEKDGWRARGEGYTGGEQSNPSLFDTNSRPNPPLSGQCAWIALHLVLLGAVNSGMVGGDWDSVFSSPFPEKQRKLVEERNGQPIQKRSM